MNPLDKLKLYVSPLGAVIALVSLFLPWLRYEVDFRWMLPRFESGAIVTGADLPGVFWIVIATTLIILGVFARYHAMRALNRAKYPILITTFAAFCAVTASLWSRSQSVDLFVSILPSVQFGAYLTCFGYIVAGLGALLLSSKSVDGARASSLEESSQTLLERADQSALARPTEASGKIGFEQWMEMSIAGDRYLLTDFGRIQLAIAVTVTGIVAALFPLYDPNTYESELRLRVIPVGAILLVYLLHKIRRALANSDGFLSKGFTESSASDAYLICLGAALSGLAVLVLFTVSPDSGLSSWKTGAFVLAGACVALFWIASIGLGDVSVRKEESIKEALTDIAGDYTYQKTLGLRDWLCGDKRQQPSRSMAWYILAMKYANIGDWERARRAILKIDDEELKKSYLAALEEQQAGEVRRDQ